MFSMMTCCFSILSAIDKLAVLYVVVSLVKSRHTVFISAY